jgi:hypothetical protein
MLVGLLHKDREGSSDVKLDDIISSEALLFELTPKNWFRVRDIGIGLRHKNWFRVRDMGIDGS